MHGGDIDGVSRRYGIPVGELVDFSASLNPAGLPAAALARLRREVVDAGALSRYPDPQYAELRAVLAARLDVPGECLTIANGAAALLGAAVRALGPRTCLLVVPAFAGHGRALDAAGCRAERFAVSAADGFRLDVAACGAAIERLRPDLCLVTNPHNPSGALLAAAEVLRLAEVAARAGVRLIVDEAFIDFAPRDSVAPDAARSSGLVVIRSLTKFYGMASLRVGYAVSAPATAAAIGAHLPAWPVTTLAASAAAEAVRDDEYGARTLATVALERMWLRDALGAMGVDACPSAANFLLLTLPPGSACSACVRDRLIGRHHLIVRDCRSFEGLTDGRTIRVGIRTRDDNARLVRALEIELRGECDESR